MKIIYSEILKQKIAIKNGWIKAEDGTTYSPKEIKFLASMTDSDKISIHQVKNKIGGEIINICYNNAGVWNGIRNNKIRS